MNFNEFASWLNSYLTEKGYKLNSDNENQQYYLDAFSYFWISYKGRIIYFHREYSSFHWSYLDFNTCPHPDIEVYMNLFKKLANEFMVKEKQRIMQVKLKKLNEDF